MKRERRLRLIATEGQLIGPPPTPPPPAITSVGAALAVMRAAASILEELPEDQMRGYTLRELDAHHEATERMLEAFHVLDRLTSTPPPTRRSQPEHPHHPTRKPTRNGANR